MQPHGSSAYRDFGTLGLVVLPALYVLLARHRLPTVELGKSSDAGKTGWDQLSLFVVYRPTSSRPSFLGQGHVFHSSPLDEGVPNK